MTSLKNDFMVLQNVQDAQKEASRSSETHIQSALSHVYKSVAQERNRGCLDRMREKLYKAAAQKAVFAEVTTRILKNLQVIQKSVIADLHQNLELSIKLLAETASTRPKDPNGTPQTRFFRKSLREEIERKLSKLSEIVDDLETPREAVDYFCSETCGDLMRKLRSTRRRVLLNGLQEDQGKYQSWILSYIFVTFPSW